MSIRLERHQFASDNTAGICPEAQGALLEANHGQAPSYGEDLHSARLTERIREIFETDCEAFLVFNGTAANGLALAQVCQSFHAVVCHKQAHIHTDECGAPEFFTHGSKLLLAEGEAGKIDLVQVAAMVTARPDVHASKPRVISLTQSTELGTVYRPEEIEAVSELARAQDMLVHMDGARFSNAVVQLRCAPKEITWQRGVDVLCFGGTKNGLAAGELVIFFRRELARGFDYRVKQAGQLASKTRLLAAPWLALLANDVWVKNATQANAAARDLAQRLRAAGYETVFPVESNAVFLRLPDRVAAGLQERGWHFYKFIEPDVYRLMCSWAIRETDITEFVADLNRTAAT
jgi:threonine aldolase